MESRLNRNLERKSKQRFILTIAGTILILILLLRFGVPLLVNFSLFIAGVKSNSSSSQTTNSQFVSPPILDTTLTATNSASIDISGNAAANESVKLYVNNTAVDEVNTQSDGSFTFKGVTLTQGGNEISAKAKNGNSESAMSDSVSITYATNVPALSIDQPSDGQGFSGDQKTVTVKGKTDPNIRVTVNGFWAVTDATGNYSYTLSLQSGDNKIDVIASDTAGNKAEKVITVHYSQ